MCSQRVDRWTMIAGELPGNANLPIGVFSAVESEIKAAIQENGVPGKAGGRRV
jgi:hypothetical protein